MRNKLSLRAPLTHADPKGELGVFSVSRGRFGRQHYLQPPTLLLYLKNTPGVTSTHGYREETEVISGPARESV